MKTNHILWTQYTDTTRRHVIQTASTRREAEAKDVHVGSVWYNSMGHGPYYLTRYHYIHGGRIDHPMLTDEQRGELVPSPII